ncbi:MAG: DNA alkylation repair protein [Acidimicrobiales bacterium]|nr:DNA alkylation repair protein [Acidimicrobiales bacterium]
MDTDAVVTTIVDRLRAVATPERAVKEKQYLRSDLEHLGATMPAIRRVAVGVGREHPDLTRDELLALTAASWEAGVHELRVVAVELLVDHPDLLVAEDTAWLETWCRQARTWALIDPLAAQVIGGLADRHPDALDPVIRRWATDEDHWVRRTALLAHLLPLRRGEGDFDRFGELADGMLEEREFFIRKAIGWVLRETGKARPERVVAWLEPRVDRAAGLTVREAVKRLPPEDRDRILDAYAARG